MLRKAMEDLSHLPEWEYKEKVFLFVMRSLLKDDPDILSHLDEALREEE